MKADSGLEAPAGGSADLHRKAAPCLVSSVGVCRAVPGVQLQA